MLSKSVLLAQLISILLVLVDPVWPQQYNQRYYTPRTSSTNRYPSYGYPYQQQQQQQNYGSSNAASYDARYFKHGSRENEQNGGTCREFLRMNGLNACCASRDDDCYMIHYDTRCYCDIFCDRSRQNDNSDCCPDSGETCLGQRPLTRPTTTATTSTTTECESL